MPIKWSAAKLSDALDMAEEYAGKAAEPLEQLKLVVKEALNLPNLPQDMVHRLIYLLAAGDRLESVGEQVKNIREHIPKSAMETERRNAKAGVTSVLL